MTNKESTFTFSLLGFIDVHGNDAEQATKAFWRLLDLFRAIARQEKMVGMHCIEGSRRTDKEE